MAGLGTAEIATAAGPKSGFSGLSTLNAAAMEAKFAGLLLMSRDRSDRVPAPMDQAALEVDSAQPPQCQPQGAEGASGAPPTLERAAQTRAYVKGKCLSSWGDLRTPVR